MIAAAAVASDEPSRGRRLAARRGRRRPVKRETESSHGLKESTPQLGKRAAPDGKTRFMLLSTQRSGTHYVMHELRRHPDVYTYDEIFYRHHRRRSFGPTHMRQGIEMFFGARAYKDDVIDGRYGWAASPRPRPRPAPRPPPYARGRVAAVRAFQNTMLDVVDGVQIRFAEGRQWIGTVGALGLGGEYRTLVLTPGEAVVAVRLIPANENAGTRRILFVTSGGRVLDSGGDQDLAATCVEINQCVGCASMASRTTR